MIDMVDLFWIIVACNVMCNLYFWCFIYKSPNLVPCVDYFMRNVSEQNILAKRAKNVRTTTPGCFRAP